jgi:acetyltransferase-like isoleucine patch superfamily enzyme
MQRFKKWEPPIIDPDTGWAYENKVFGQKYGWRCQHPAGLKLGENTDVGCFTYMNAKYGIEIGDNTQIGSHCSIYSDNTENNTHGKVIIGKDCLIGSFCLILPNSVIPDGTKLKAYSIWK